MTQEVGELYFWSSRFTGIMLSGVPRCRKGMAGTGVALDGALTTPYSGTLGDEMILLLDGKVSRTRD